MSQLDVRIEQFIGIFRIDARVMLALLLTQRHREMGIGISCIDIKAANSNGDNYYRIRNGANGAESAS